MPDNQNPVYTDGVSIQGDGTEEHPLVAGGGGFSKIQIIQHQYTLTNADVAAGFTAQVNLTWPDTFGDTDYAVAFTVMDVTVTSPGECGPNSIGPKSATGVDNVSAFVGGAAVAGDVIEFDLIGVHS